MTVVDRGDSRPPPVTERKLNISTPGIPWYRDVKVIRIVAQIAFAIAAIAAGVFLVNGLVTNLRASNLSLDFNIFRGPFNVAINEGPSLTEEWAWLQETSSIITATWIVWGLLIAVLVWIARRELRAGRLGLPELILTGALVFAFFRLTPDMIAGFISGLGVDPELAATIGSVLWIGLLVLAIIVGYNAYSRHRLDLRPAINVLVVLAFVALLTPPDATGRLIADTLQDLFRGGTIARAFATGMTNTLIVVVVSLVGCTVLGIFVGIGLLSSNYLVRTLSAVYVEIFRNTPLLIQLLFIYRTFTLLLPAPRQSIFSPEWLGPNSLYILNARGFYFPALVPTETATFFWVGLIGALIVFFGMRYWRLRAQDNTGQPARLLRFALLPALLIFAAGYLISGTPFTVDYPVLDRLNIVGGMNFSIAFVSLFMGLTLYTAAFVADIVRAGIQAVPYGQIEAARAQGFSRGQVLNLIVLPQALRLIVPPLGNQYVNLSKNSSLAVAVTYVDVYRVASLANNESGQAVPFFVGLMLIYLAISLILSLIMNSVNQLTRVRTR